MQIEYRIILLKLLKIIIFLLVSNSIKADIPKSIYLEIELNSELYFLMMSEENTDQIKNLNYDIGNIIETFFTATDSIEVFKNYRKIPTEAIKRVAINSVYPDTLYVVGNKIRLNRCDLMNFNLKEIHPGNEGGYDYTIELATEDISWINDYPIRSLGHIPENREACNYEIFALENHLSQEEINSFLHKISKQAIREKGIWLGQKSNYTYIFKKYIFIIGFCSC